MNRNVRSKAFDVFFATIIFIALFVAACQMNSAPSKINTDNITYFQDKRTGLCFAAMNSFAHSNDITVITNVPCTDKVKSHIEYYEEKEQ